MDTKAQIKHFLFRIGLWNSINLLRKSKDVLRWFATGCSGVAPSPIKMRVVNSYLSRYSINSFIETGTYLGDTLEYIAHKGIKCISIELSESLYNTACVRFNRYHNVKLVNGDSGQELPKLINGINSPVLFWLDGHYSFGPIHQSDAHTPISLELQAILSHHIKKHIILIDDARCFNGTNDYPHLDVLLRMIREDGNYRADVSADIIRLIPITIS